MKLRNLLLNKQDQAQPPARGVSFAVVGLGNPGPNYAGNRHNVGQMVLSELADRSGAGFRRHKSNAMLTEVRTAGGNRLVLAKPLSFMNVSGGPTVSVLRYFSLKPDSLIVVHDELDIPFGEIRIKVGGGHGGHNGLRDIIAATGTNEFTRIRVGVGRPPGRMAAADYVLRDFTGTERAELPERLVFAADAIEAVADRGQGAAQQMFNTPR